MVCAKRYASVEDNNALHSPPTIMIIPEDPDSNSNALCDVQSYSNTSDINKLLKVIEEHSISSLEAALSKGISVNGYGGAFHETPLHKAAQDGWKEGVRLLMRSGAVVYSKNQFGQTPLHYASASKSCECVRIILEAGCQATLDHRDMRGHTPLHDAAGVGCVDCVQLLLKAGALVGVCDNNGETPLHKAAKSRSVPCMLALLNKGADFGAKDHTGESALSHFLRHMSGGMELLFDYCLVPNTDKLSLKKLEITYNFIPISGIGTRNQMKNLNDIVELDHPKLLLHPVCEAYLLLKWLNVRRLFFIEVIFYFIHAILATLLILYKFVWINGNEEFHSNNRTLVQAFKIILLIQAVLILVKQVVTMMQGFRTWIFSLWHVLNGVIPVMVLLVIPGESSLWQHHIATIVMLFIWVQCMLHIGRFPGSGIYVAMFTRVAKVFLRIFLVFFCLLLAFSMSFYVSNAGIQYGENYSNESNNTEYSVYQDPIHTFYKTLTMMIGELDFDDSTVKDLNTLPFTSHVIYLAFVILVSIILSNLLVALAVNDVQGLRNSAHLERLIKQMELVFQFEKTFSSIEMLAGWLKLKKFTLWTRSFIINLFNCKVFLQPHHPQKGNKIILKEKNIMKEINIRQTYVKTVMESIHNREDQPSSSDRKISIRKRKSRPIRNEYSTGLPTDGAEIIEALKHIEVNMSDNFAEKMEDLSNLLILRLDAFEDRLSILESNVERMLQKSTDGNVEDSSSQHSEGE